jgi:hypothetical protein
MSIGISFRDGCTPFIPTAHRNGAAGVPVPVPRQRSSFTSPAPRSPSPVPRPQGDKGHQQPAISVSTEPPRTVPSGDRNRQQPEGQPVLGQVIHIPLSSRNEGFSWPRNKWRGLRLRRFDRLAPLPSPLGEDAHPAAAEVAQQVGTPFTKIVERELLQRNLEPREAPVRRSVIKTQVQIPDLSNGDHDTNHTATRFRGSAGWAVCPSILAGVLSPWVWLCSHSFTLNDTSGYPRGRQPTVQIPQRAAAAPTFPRCR